jgi:hypothetical protein
VREQSDKGCCSIWTRAVAATTPGGGPSDWDWLLSLYVSLRSPSFAVARCRGLAVHVRMGGKADTKFWLQDLHVTGKRKSRGPAV